MPDKLSGARRASAPASRGQALRYLLVQPGLWMLWFTVFFVALSAGGLGVGGALVVPLAGVVGVAGSRRVRGIAAREQRRRRRQQRIDARLARLLGCSQDRRVQIAELSRKLDEIEDFGSGLDRVCDLQELVDRCVDVAVRHARLTAAAEIVILKPTLGEAWPTRERAPASRLLSELTLRRIAEREDCARRAWALEVELAAVVELVGLAHQLASCPEEPDDGEPELRRTLAALESFRSVERQLLVAAS